MSTFKLDICSPNIGEHTPTFLSEKLSINLPILWKHTSSLKVGICSPHMGEINVSFRMGICSPDTGEYVSTFIHEKLSLNLLILWEDMSSLKIGIRSPHMREHNVTFKTDKCSPDTDSTICLAHVFGWNEIDKFCPKQHTLWQFMSYGISNNVKISWLYFHTNPASPQLIKLLLCFIRKKVNHVLHFKIKKTKSLQAKLLSKRGLMPPHNLYLLHGIPDWIACPSISSIIEFSKRQKEEPYTLILARYGGLLQAPEYTSSSHVVFNLYTKFNSYPHFNPYS